MFEYADWVIWTFPAFILSIRCDGAIKGVSATIFKNRWCCTNSAVDLRVMDHASEKEAPSLTKFQQQYVKTAAADDSLGDIVFLLNSGLRVSKLINLEWNNYNKRYQELHIRESKTKAGIRIIPLTPTVIDIIEQQTHIYKYP